MKQLTSLSLGFLSLLLMMSACSKDGNIAPISIPTVVKKAFNERFAAAKSVKWSKIETVYEAEFEQNNTDMEVLMDKDGNVLEVETDIAVTSIPSAASTYISTHYTGKKIDEAKTIQKTTGSGESTSSMFYEVELEGDNQEIEVLFDADGNFISEEIENDDDEEDDDNDDDND